MKILQIIPSYFPAIFSMGVSGPMHSLNRALVRQGIDVTVYTTNHDDKQRMDVPLNQETLLDGVKVCYFPTIYRPWNYSFALERALARHVKEFDVVHISSVFLSVSALGARYAKKFHKPYLISPHGSLMEEPLKHKAIKKRVYLELLERGNLIGATAIHFTTEQEKKEYLEAGLPPSNAFVVPYCFEAPLVGPRVAGSKKILFLGRISWKKGFDTLIPAMAQVLKTEPRAVLVIAGPDDEGYIRYVRSLIARFKLEEKVIFTGVVTGRDKWAVYQEADAFVLPSYSENFGMAVVEAMAAGLPVLITRGVGIWKEVEQAGAGLVAAKDNTSVARAILKILHNPGLARAMGERGAKLVRTEWSVGKVGARFIKAYEEIINTHATTD